MTKQSKEIYVSLINRLAIALLLNQGLILIFARFLNIICEYLKNTVGATDLVDAFCLSGECVSYFLSFLLPVLLFNKMNKYSQKEIYEPVDSDKKSPLYAVLVLGMGLVAILCSSFINYLLIELFTDYSDFSSEMLWSVELNKPYQIVIYVISYAIIPALVEELLFRGTVCKALSVYGKVTAVIISAALFSLMHTNIEQLIYTFVAGLFFGWLYVETKSLIFPILLHFVNNFISVLGEIIYQNCSVKLYEAYASLSNLAVLLFGLISCVGFLAYVKKKNVRFEKGVRMKPDENGDEALPLTVSERISGFFSVGMMIFIAYCITIMSYYVYLSVVL